MTVNFNEHQWVNQGNINKVKKLIMSVEEFNKLRIEVLEKRIKELEDEKNKDNPKGSLGCNSPKCVCKQKEV